MNKYTVYLAWLIAIFGTFLSLILSNVYQWEICHLCWYQRACLYPLVLILGIACFRKDNSIGIYALPLTLIGFVLSLYQYLEQMIPGFAPIDVCGSGPSCSNIHMKVAGFITLPFLSILAFLAMSALLFIALKERSNKKQISK